MKAMFRIDRTQQRIVDGKVLDTLTAQISGNTLVDLEVGTNCKIAEDDDIRTYLRFDVSGKGYDLNADENGVELVVEGYDSLVEFVLAMSLAALQITEQIDFDITEMIAGNNND